jgi:beta-galactosidase GanA
VKRDYRRFPRARLADGRAVEVLSTLSDANLQADARAFAALMRHLSEVDGAEHTVLMVQVENEVGILGDSRDRSDAANAAFAGPVPRELLDWLPARRADLAPELASRWESSGRRASGSWSEVFGEGPEADEIFMAWHYATYVDAVAKVGRAEYDLPMFVNAWLSNPYQKPGDWPSGGPLPHVRDLWRAGAPHVDLITPDIYQSNFQEWCQRYADQGNPLFIPEMRRGEDGARGVLYAVGQHDAIGTSPFAVDSIEGPETSPFARVYSALRQVAPLILEHQGKGETTGFVLDSDHASIRRELGGYELEILLDGEGYGLIVAEGPDAFVGVGSGFRVAFHTSGSQRVGIVAVDEGEYEAGRWIAGRRLNGDESAQGQSWRFPDQRVGVQRCVVYRYE